MGRHTDIERALMQGVVDCALGIPFSVENAPFEKPSGDAPWASVWILTTEGSVRAVTCGEAGEDEHVGVLQIDLNYPLMRGTRDARVAADLVSSFFRAGRRMAYGMATVTVRSCSKSTGREVDGWHRTSMSVQWYARVPRNGF